MAKAVRKTPQEATEKWVTKLGQAGPEMQAGVARVTEAPGAAAAAQVQKYVAGVQENINKWRANVARVSLSDWQKSMTELGIPRVAQGAQQKRGKMEAFQAEFFPFLDRVLAEVNRMPTTTKAQRIAKMVATVEKTGQFKRSGSASGTHMGA